MSTICNALKGAGAGLVGGGILGGGFLLFASAGSLCVCDDGPDIGLPDCGMGGCGPGGGIGRAQRVNDTMSQCMKEMLKPYHGDLKACEEGQWREMEGMAGTIVGIAVVAGVIAALCFCSSSQTVVEEEEAQFLIPEASAPELESDLEQGRPREMLDKAAGTGRLPDPPRNVYNGPQYQ